MAILIFLLAFPILLLFVLQKHKKSSKKVSLPPGPKGVPVFGNLLQLDKSNVPCYLWQLSKQYGPLLSLKLGLRPTIVVSSAKMAQEVLKTQDLKFCSRPALLGLQTLSYNGLDLAFTPYSAYWREIRKITVVHLFNSIRSQSYHPIREHEVSLMLKKICKSIDASKPVNLTETMMSLTSTIICRIALGKRYEDEGVERSRFQSLLNETQAMSAGLFFSDYFPHVSWLDRLTGMLPRLQKNFREFDEFYDEIIKEHIDPERPKPEREDILDVLLHLWKDRSFKVDLTFNHVKAVLMNVFVAGTDTSAAAVIWAMTFLMKNPLVMKKVQEEIRSFVGKKGFVVEEDVRQLQYLKAVVKETMRLQPTVPLLIPRETIQKSYLGGYEIPERTLVYVNALAIGRDPEAWDNPDEFVPERFIGKSIDFKGQDYELVPFGAGRRICPGIFMGTATLEISLANLLYKFDWEMPSGMKREDIDTDVLPGITMHKKDALLLMAEKYNI